MKTTTAKSNGHEMKIKLHEPNKNKDKYEIRSVCVRAREYLSVCACIYTFACFSVCRSQNFILCLSLSTAMSAYVCFGGGRGCLCTCVLSSINQAIRLTCA